MPSGGKLLAPLFFAVIGMMIGVILAAINEVLFGVVEPNPLFPPEEGDEETTARLETALAVLIFAVLGPLLAIVFLSLTTLANHLLLLVMGSGRQGIRSTFRAVSYVFGATFLFSAIPLLGPLIAAVWSTFSLIMAISRAHKTSLMTAVVAVFGAQAFWVAGLLLLLVMAAE